MITDRRFTMAQAWEDYLSIVLPRLTSPALVKEFRKTFYAGAETLLSQILSPGASGVDINRVEELRLELVAFALDVNRGRI